RGTFFVRTEWAPARHSREAAISQHWTVGRLRWHREENGCRETSPTETQANPTPANVLLLLVRSLLFDTDRCRRCGTREMRCSRCRVTKLASDHDPDQS